MPPAKSTRLGEGDGTPPARRDVLSPGASLALDVLRAGSAQLVLLGHAFDFFGVFSHLGTPDPPPQIQRMAVVVFFLLSGFLIAYTIDHKRNRPDYGFQRYLSDRFARIYSGLLPALLVIAVIDQLPFGRFETDYPGPQPTLAAFFVNALLLMEYPGTGWRTFGTGDPLWTLPIEWWLYLFSGFVLLGGRRWWTWALFALACGSVVLNTVGGTGAGIALVWFFGAAVYLLWRGGVGRKLPAAVMYVGAATFVGLALIRVYLFNPRAELKGLEIGFAALLAAALFLLLRALGGSATTAPRRRPRVVTAFAGASYTLYLVHFSVLTVLYEWRGEIAGPTLLVLGLVGANVVAFAVAACGERHHRRLAQWLFRGSGRPVAKDLDAGDAPLSGEQGDR